MTNVTLVPKEETKAAASSQTGKSSTKKEKQNTSPPGSKLPADQKEAPVNNWIMPPEQQGYIQGNDRDCL